MAGIAVAAVLAPQFALAQDGGAGNPIETQRAIRVRLLSVAFVDQGTVDMETIAWAPDGKSLLVDRRGGNQFFGINKMSISEGKPAEYTVLTRGRGNKPVQKHEGNAAWAPDGKSFIFCAQNDNDNSFKPAEPGYGIQNNLWLADAEQKSFWQLTNIPTSYSANRGVSSPQFSRDGKRLFWTECLGKVGLEAIWGERALMTGTFSMANGRPQISDIKKFQPGVKQDFYESCGFSPDGKKLLFAANMSEERPWYGSDICVMDDNGQNLRNLTQTEDVWDRYASFSPAGSKITWCSSNGMNVPYLGTGGKSWQTNMQSELWIMNGDGSDKRQQTHFNDPGAPEFLDRKCYVGSHAWNPDGRRIAAILHHVNRQRVVVSTICILELTTDTVARVKVTPVPVVKK